MTIRDKEIPENIEIYELHRIKKLKFSKIDSFFSQIAWGNTGKFFGKLMDISSKQNLEFLDMQENRIWCYFTKDYFEKIENFTLYHFIKVKSLMRKISLVQYEIEFNSRRKRNP